MHLSIQVFEKNGEYVASCPELNVHCFGPDKEKAISRLRSVIQFYFDSAIEDNQSHNQLSNKNFAEIDGSQTNKIDNIPIH